MPGGFLSETEVFRNCVKYPVHLQHNDLLQIDENGEEHIKAVKTKEEAQEESARQTRRELLRLFYKIWSGFSKYIRSQLSKGRSVDTLYFGKLGRNGESENDTKYIYVPSIEFIDSNNLIFDECDKYNLSPFTNMAKFLGSFTTVSISAIAASVKTTKDTVKLVLKEVFHRVGVENKEGRDVKLDLKVGYLQIMGGTLRFINDRSARQSEEQRPAGQRPVNQTFELGQMRRGSGAAEEKDSVHQTEVSFASIATPSRRVRERVKTQGVASTISSHKSSISERVKRALFESAEASPAYPNLNQYIQKGLRGAMQHRGFFATPTKEQAASRRQMLDFHLKQMRQKERRQRVLHRAKEIGMEAAVKEIEEEDKRDKRKKLETLSGMELSSSTKHSILGSARPLSNPRTVGVRDPLTSQSGRANSLQPLQSNFGTSVTEGRFDSSNRKMPAQFIAGYPSFLKPDHQEERRWGGNIEVNLNKALARYEDVLKAKQVEKETDAKNYYDQLANTELFNKNVETMRAMAMEEHKRAILHQIKEARQRKEREDTDRKSYIRTHFGPEDTDKAVIAHQDITHQKKFKFREDILKQIKVREREMAQQNEERKKAEKLQNHIEDCTALATAAKVLADERRAILGKFESHRSELRSAWDWQASQKKKNDTIETLFKP